MLEDPPLTYRISLARRVDLDDFGAKLGQDTASKRPGNELADLEDAHPIKGTRRDGVGGCHSRVCASIRTSRSGSEASFPHVHMRLPPEDACAQSSALSPA